MNLFKGYIKTSGKKPIEKVRDSERLYEHTDLEGDFGGVLKDEIVMIDVDDASDADKVRDILAAEGIKCESLKTTRGRHFYFINNGLTTNKIGTLTLCGIKVDIKLGSKNTVVPLRIDGVTREFKESPQFIDVLPTFLKPSRYAKDLSKSQSRNQDLFNYILSLQSDGYNKEDIRNVLTIINKYIFTEPLPNSELETILRNEAFIKPSFYSVDEKGRRKFKHNALGDWLIKELRIVRINGLLHSYCEGEYVLDTNLEHYIIEEIEELESHYRKEVLTYINAKLTEGMELADSRYICVGNGIYNLETDELVEHNPNVVITNKIPINYNPNARGKLIEKTFRDLACGDAELVELFFEVIGYCLYRRNELGKFFVLTGDGGGGKSTLLTILKRLIGTKNRSSVGIHDLEKRFQNTSIVGKLVNIGDDIDSAYLEKNEVLKKVVTGDDVQFEFKNQTPFQYQSYAKFLFAANEIPRCRDLTDGLARRMVIIPFNAKFSKESGDYDPFIIDKLQTKENLEYILHRSIKALKGVLQNRSLTEAEAVRLEKEKFEANNNSVVGFMKDGAKVENEFCDDVYRKYCRWCDSQGINALSQNRLGRELNRKYNFKSKSSRVKESFKKIYYK